MRRIFLLAVISLMALALSGCGGTPADTTIADPPRATQFEKGDNTQINKLVDDWKSTIPTEMQNQKIKPETIEQKVYLSEASIQEIADFYKTLNDKGWREVKKMPGLQDNVFLSGYESGSTTLVVDAVDTAQLGGKGILVYTVKGTK